MGSSFFSSDDFERRGFELYSKGCFEAALTIFRRGVLQFPAVPDLYEGLGNCYLELGEYVLAARYFEQGLVYSPDHVAMLAGLGQAYVMLGYPLSAVRCFEMVMDVGTQEVALLVRISRSLYEIEKFEESIDCSDSALTVDADNAEAYFCKAASLSSLGAHLTETEPLFKRALEIEHRGDMVCYYANVLYESRQYKRALAVFETVPTEDISDIISLERMIKLYRRFKDKDREIARCMRRVFHLRQQRTFEGFVRSLHEEWKQEDTIKNKDNKIH